MEEVTEDSVHAIDNDGFPRQCLTTGQVRRQMQQFRLEKDGNNDLVTHYSMLYGRYVIPYDQLDILHDAVRRSVEVVEDPVQPLRTLPYVRIRQPFYLVERRTPIFPYIYDFDIYTAPQHDLPLSEFYELLRCVQLDVMQKIVTRRADEDDDQYDWRLRAIISTAPLVVKKKVVSKCGDDGECNRVEIDLPKRGYHVIYPEVHVDKTVAYAIRDAVIETLSKRFKQRFISFKHPEDGQLCLLDGGWQEFVDESVIKENGLRMLYAHKAEPCKNHKKTVDEERKCIECGSSARVGRLDGGRPYQIVGLVDGSGHTNTERIRAELLHLRRDVLYALRCTSVRLDEAHAALTPIRFDPHFVFDDKQRRSIANKVNNSKKRSAGEVFDQTESLPGTMSMNKRNFTSISEHSPMFKQLEALICDLYDGAPWYQVKYGGRRIKSHYNRRSLWDEWGGVANAWISDPTGGKQHPYFFVYFMNRFCVNVERTHSGNRPYCVIKYRTSPTPGWVATLGCHSTKERVTVAGTVENTNNGNLNAPTCKSDDGKAVFACFDMLVQNDTITQLLVQMKLVESRDAIDLVDSGVAQCPLPDEGVEAARENIKKIKDVDAKNIFGIMSNGFIVYRTRPYDDEDPNVLWYNNRPHPSIHVNEQRRQQLLTSEEERLFREDLAQRRRGQVRKLHNQCAVCRRALFIPEYSNLRLTTAAANVASECQCVEPSHRHFAYECARCGRSAVCSQKEHVIVGMQQCRCELGPVY